MNCTARGHEQEVFTSCLTGTIKNARAGAQPGVGQGAGAREMVAQAALTFPQSESFTLAALWKLKLRELGWRLGH